MVTADNAIFDMFVLYEETFCSQTHTFHDTFLVHKLRLGDPSAFCDADDDHSFYLIYF